MAVVLLFRVAIAITPALVRWGASGGSTYGGSIEHGLLSAWNYFIDPEKSAEDVEEQLNSAYDAESNPGWVVTDFTGTFELRKLQWRFSRAPSGGTVEDQDVITFHFLKTSAGAPGTWVDGTDLAAVESAANTYFSTWAAMNPSFFHSDQYRWYKDGPAFWELNDAGTAYVPIPGNPAIRVTEVDTAGSQGGTTSSPPQVACAVTEKTSRRANWGRYYLPIMSPAVTTIEGRLTTAQCDSLVAGAVTFYNACRAANVTPVVWSIPKPERTTKGGGTLPAQPGTAFEVLSIQVDNIFDIIRSRRYAGPTYRKVTALT